MKMRRGSALFSGLMTIRSGASRISIGNSPSSHIAKIGPPGWQGTTFLMSPRRRDCSSPHGVNGGFDGHSVFDHGGGPAGSSNVPTATQTPGNPSCDTFEARGVPTEEPHAEKASMETATTMMGRTDDRAAILAPQAGARGAATPQRTSFHARNLRLAVLHLDKAHSIACGIFEVERRQQILDVSCGSRHPSRSPSGTIWMGRRAPPRGTHAMFPPRLHRQRDRHVDLATRGVTPTR